jgi:hypothetical protein
MVFMRFLLSTLVVIANAAPTQDEKRAIPDASSQKEALKLIRDIFKEEYGRKAPADRQALAAKLLQQALESKDDPTSQYVLFEETRGLAAEGGDVPTALKAVEELSTRFAVNRAALMLSSLTTAGLTARAPEQLAAQAEALLKLADEAVAAQDFETAEKAAASATTSARAAKILPLVTQADAKTKELAGLKSRLAAFKKAKETLTTNPQDPVANLAVGRFLCLTLGNWEEGLPYLSKGSELPLKELASRDLSLPAEASAKASLADAWWDLGEKEAGKSRDLARGRACFWYEAALGDLTGLSRAKAEKRIKESPVRARSKSIDLLRLIDVQKDVSKGIWERLSTGSLAVNGGGILEIPYAFPAEYDLTLRVERKEGVRNLFIVLPFPSGKCSVTIDQEDTGDLVGLSLIDGLRAIENETAKRMKLLARGKTSTVTYVMRKTGVSLVVDGKVILDWKGALNRLSVVQGNSGTRPETALFGGSASFLFHSVELVPVSESGKPLR